MFFYLKSAIYYNSCMFASHASKMVNDSSELYLHASCIGTEIIWCCCSFHNSSSLFILILLIHQWHGWNWLIVVSLFSCVTVCFLMGLPNDVQINMIEKRFRLLFILLQTFCKTFPVVMETHSVRISTQESQRGFSHRRFTNCIEILCLQFQDSHSYIFIESRPTLFT